MKGFSYLALLSVFLFASCTSFSEKEKQVYTVKGNEISQKAFKALSSELMAQMKAGGPVQAVSFCNVNALPLTETVSKENGVQIKRTSDKIRNTANEATARELEVIMSYKSLMGSGQELRPVVEKEGKQVHYYAPIKVQAACLNCHGDARQVSKPADSILKLKYPDDVARYYKEGDLRGIWSITFDEVN